MAVKITCEFSANSSRPEEPRLPGKRFDPPSMVPDGTSSGGAHGSVAEYGNGLERATIFGGGELLYSSSNRVGVLTATPVLVNGVTDGFNWTNDTGFAMGADRKGNVSIGNLHGTVNCDAPFYQDAFLSLPFVPAASRSTACVGGFTFLMPTRTEFQYSVRPGRSYTSFSNERLTRLADTTPVFGATRRASAADVEVDPDSVMAS